MTRAASAAAPATVRYSAADPANHGAGRVGALVEADFARPDGRWNRVLRAVATTPLSVGAIHAAVRRPPGQRTGNSRIEKMKTLQTVGRLVRHGYIARLPAGGFITTHKGLAAIAAADAAGGLRLDRKG